MPTLRRRLAAEAFGTALLLMTVVGSGIMAERLSGGNIAIALMGNTLATGAVLAVLITVFGPISGAHFNPAVSLVFALRREISPGGALMYTAVQVAAAIAGVWLAHLMFGETVIQVSNKVRSGLAQGFSEFIATFGLVLTIVGTSRTRPDFIAVAVALYITGAYWFTASTSFANPAVTVARALTDTFAGIRAADAPLFILAQVAGAMAALFLSAWLFSSKPAEPTP